MTNEQLGDRLGQDLSRDLSQKVVQHRDDFYQFFVGRYIEGLATLFSYSCDKPFNKMTLEIALRMGYGVAYGKNKFGNPCILGYIQYNNGFNYQTPDTLFKPRRFTGADINYIVPDEVLPERAKTHQFVEIWDNDGANTGDFVVFWNKRIQLVNDYQVISHYASELAEIVASRYSLIMQSKIMTVFAGNVGDETINQLISDLYNGNPFVKLGKQFDVEDNIIKVDNTNLSNNLAQLKTEYQNEIAELNASFGINVLAVDKESGVTDAEANGNLGYVTMNGNIWLESRQLALDRYNKRYGTDFKVTIDGNAVGKLAGDTQHESNDDNL